MRFNCILLVDDDRVSNFLTEKVIRGMGISSMIITVNDGKKALEYIKNECTQEMDGCPDLILLDVNMPLLNGVEFMELYNKIENKRMQSLVIVLSSTELPEDYRKRLQDSNVSDFLIKPFTVEKMQSVLGKYLPEKV
ncbi:MAG: response regulator [Cytophagaceae bacterium]